jgi:hypothetical protein
VETEGYDRVVAAPRTWLALLRGETDEVERLEPINLGRNALRWREELPALLGGPLESHCRETVNGPLDEQFVVAEGAQGAQGEWNVRLMRSSYRDRHAQEGRRNGCGIAVRACVLSSEELL